MRDWVARPPLAQREPPEVGVGVLALEERMPSATQVHRDPGADEDDGKLGGDGGEDTCDSRVPDIQDGLPIEN